MKAKRYLVAGAATALALGLTACGGSTGSTGSGSSASGAASDDSNCADAAVFCIGLVTDTGKVDDKSFNQASHEGAKAAAAADGGFYKYVETQDAKDYAANMAQFTNKKYDVVVTVGFLMTDATAEAAGATDCSYTRHYEGEEDTSLPWFCPECEVMFTATVEMNARLDEVKWQMLEEWSRTKRAPKKTKKTKKR